MNWYKKIKISSVRDDKQEQAKYFTDKIEEAISQAQIGGEETIKLLEQLVSKLDGAHGFRNLLPVSITKELLSLLNQAISVKKDSPQKCCAFLEDALDYLL